MIKLSLLKTKYCFYVLSIVLIIPVIYIYVKYVLNENHDERIYEIDEELCTNYMIKKQISVRQTLVSSFKQKSLHKIAFDSPKLAVQEYMPVKTNDKDLRHLIPLAISAIITNGDLLDLAIDIHTTQVLRKIAKDQNRFLVSIENEYSWFSNFLEWNNTYNHLLLPTNSVCYNTLNIQKKWAIVTIDHLNDFRHELIKKLALNAQMFLVHNSLQSNVDLFRKLNYYETLFKYNCKSSTIFNDGSYSELNLYSNFDDAFLDLKKIIDNIQTPSIRYICNLKE